MVAIIYSEKYFRHVLDIWQDEHPDYTNDIAFLEIKNVFKDSEEVNIHMGIMGDYALDGEQELCFNSTIIRFSNSPFCSYLMSILKNLMCL
jgi:hypothetical protein